MTEVGTNFRRELSRRLHELQAIAEDRGRPIGERIDACRELSSRRFPDRTRESAQRALFALGDHPVPVPRELAERLDHDLAALKHLTPAERELWALLRRELGR